MNLTFLDNYWLAKTVRSNKHFSALNSELESEVKSTCIPEDKVKTMYKGQKKWDLHFPNKKIAIEYKTIATQYKNLVVANQQNNSSGKVSGKKYSNLANIHNRVEEALGCAVDVKHFDPEYKLGYILVFTMHSDQYPIPQKLIDNTISKFDKMIKNNLYDFFCPLITFGIGNHKELSPVYTWNKFTDMIKNSPNINDSPLEKFFI